MANSKIYTKTGDKGQTRLVDGSQVSKSHPRVDVYGTFDELNSHLGFLRSLLHQSFQDFEEKNLQARSAHESKSSASLISGLEDLDRFLADIQSQLFNVGSLLATQSEAVMEKLNPLRDEQILALESKIDEFDKDLPALKNFILPGGHLTSSQLHICRTVCRRGERALSQLIVDLGIQDTGHQYMICLRYTNRLSDFLFAAARWCNLKFGVADVIWKADSI